MFIPEDEDLNGPADRGNPPNFLQKFGMLVVVDWGQEDNLVLCQCDCGETKEISVFELEEGTVLNCGCDTAE